MTAVTKRQEGKWRNVRMPKGKSIRTPARPAPPCGSASSIALPRRIELQKKGPKQRQARSGQVTRPTGASRASGRRSAGGGQWVLLPAAGCHHAQRPPRESQNPGRQSADRKQSNCCGNVSSGGGNWTPPQQPCSRPLHEVGRFRLPGHHGLEGAWRPGRRRANAREMRGAHSFCGLRNECQRSARNAVGLVQFFGRTACQRHQRKPVAIRNARLLPLVDCVTRQCASDPIKFGLDRRRSACGFD